MTFIPDEQIVKWANGQPLSRMLRLVANVKNILIVHLSVCLYLPIV